MPRADPAAIRGAFADAATAFDQLVSTIDASRFADCGTDAWTVRELVGHTTRALLTVETTAAAPVDPTTRALGSAVDYFRAAIGVPGVHAGIVERGRAAGIELGQDPAQYVHETAERVLAFVARTPDDRTVQHLAGRIAFPDYLETRVLELTLHAVDLELALGVEVGAPPTAARLTRDLVLELVDFADPLAVACALSGRQTATGFNVLG